MERVVKATREAGGIGGKRPPTTLPNGRSPVGFVSPVKDCDWCALKERSSPGARCFTQRVDFGSRQKKYLCCAMRCGFGRLNHQTLQGVPSLVSRPAAITGPLSCV
eukprot:s6770_g8.t1